MTLIFSPQLDAYFFNLKKILGLGVYKWGVIVFLFCYLTGNMAVVESSFLQHFKYNQSILILLSKAPLFQAPFELNRNLSIESKTRRFPNKNKPLLH